MHGESAHFIELSEYKPQRAGLIHPHTMVEYSVAWFCVDRAIQRVDICIGLKYLSTA